MYVDLANRQAAFEIHIGGTDMLSQTLTAQLQALAFVFPNLMFIQSAIDLATRLTGVNYEIKNTENFGECG